MTSDLPSPDPGARPIDDPSSERPGSSRRRRSGGDQPNYTARRVAVGSVALALVAIGAVALLRLVGGSDDGEDAATSPGWNSIVEVDRSSGDVVVLDADGNETLTIDGIGRATEVHVDGDRLALVGSGELVLVGLDDEAPRSIPVDGSGTVRRHPSNRTFTLVLAPDVGGEIVVIDAAEGSVTPLGERAGQAAPLLLPETLRLDRAGSRYAVGDGRNFQTVVVDVDPDVEVGFFPGIPMAVSQQLVVTSTNVGRTAELGFFDPDGERLGLVTTERPVGGVLDGDRFVYVTEAGAFKAVAVDQASPSEIADLDVGTVSEVHPVLDQTRLIVVGSSRSVVVDLAGDVVAEGGPDPAMTTWDTWRCLPVGGVQPAIVDLRTGDALVELEPRPIVGVGLDGCGVHQRDGDGHVVTSPTGTYVPNGAVRSIVIAPDGTSAVVVAPDGTAELVDLADSRRLDLGTRRGLLAFAER